MADAAPGRRIDVVLVAGGLYHDFDFARLELLKLLAEHEQFRVRVQPDYDDTSALDSTPDGWAAPAAPLWADTLGSQFVAHPPIAPYRVDNVAPDHWLVKGIDGFEATDELYLNDYPDRSALVPLLETTFQGDARGFARRHWEATDPTHLVMYLRPLGAGGVLYNTLGHCRGHYDMVPVKDYYPNVDRCSWELPEFYELLRRSLRWARGGEA
jgi:hypothetical protein